jgi:hypothetical protein
MYNASRPRLRGVLRKNSYPMYVCEHDHNDPDEARACAKRALEHARKFDPSDLGLRTSELPEGWHRFDHTRDQDL